MADQTNRSDQTDDAEARVWESLDDDDALDDAVIAADDTGLLSEEAQITRVVSEQDPLPPRG